MRHIPDGVLRRLDDEPLAIPDRAIEHLAACEHCSARRAGIVRDTERAARLFAPAQLVPDTEAAWLAVQRELGRSAEGPGGVRRRAAVVAPRAWWHRLSLRAGLAIGAVSIVLAGTAAAATLTTIFAPTHVAPVAVSRHDLQAIAALTGLGDDHLLGAFSTPAGSSTFAFGTITWSSTPTAAASSAADATARAGFAVRLPARLPRGVGPVPQLIVQPRVRATVKFNSQAASLAGSAVTIAAGPAVVAQYPAAGGSGVTTLAVATMRRPTAQSTGASVSQIEAFLLDRPGIPPELAEEVRLLGDLRTTLPVPVPSGASVHSVQIDGWPGVLLADSSNAVSGVVWEDGHGLIHAVGGILDPQDVLNVAEQLS